MIAGTAIAGARFNGHIRGLRFSEAGLGGVAVSFRHDGIVAAQSFRYAVALDGELALELGPGETTAEFLLPDEEEHVVTVTPIPQGTVKIPDLHGVLYGRRAWLTWDRRGDADLAGYAVFMDGSATASATITEKQVVPLSRALPATGTGTGRLSARGDWPGANVTIAVAISAVGYFTHDASGATSDPIPFEAGSSLTITDGLLIVFEDSADAYEIGDEWAIDCGPRTAWLSGILTEATHTFTIKAMDEAGNAATASTSRAVSIRYAPDGLDSFAATYAPEDGEISLNWTSPDTACDIYIYTNFLNLTGALQDEVEEDSPWQILAGDLTELVFAPDAPGAWKFKAMRRDTDGRFSALALWAEVSTTEPPVDTIGTPEALEATLAPAGTVILTWLYRLAGAETASLAFRVYKGGVLIDTVAADYTEDEAEILSATATVGPYVGAQTFTVRAYDTGAGWESPDSNAVTITPDAAAPGQVTGLKGLDQ